MSDSTEMCCPVSGQDWWLIRELAAFWAVKLSWSHQLQLREFHSKAQSCFGFYLFCVRALLLCSCGVQARPRSEPWPTNSGEALEDFSLGSTHLGLTLNHIIWEHLHNCANIPHSTCMFFRTMIGCLFPFLKCGKASLMSSEVTVVSD